MPYAIAQRVFLIHDSPSGEDALVKSFRDPFQLFSMRVKNLGNLERPMALGEGDALFIMLDALVEARERIDMI